MQVDAQNQIFNVYIAPDGEPQRVKVGSLDDLGTIRAKDLGGIPVASLAKASKERMLRGGRITAFADPDAGSVMLPPNTPFTRDRARSRSMVRTASEEHGQASVLLIKAPLWQPLDRSVAFQTHCLRRVVSLQHALDAL